MSWELLLSLTNTAWLQDIWPTACDLQGSDPLGAPLLCFIAVYSPGLLASGLEERPQPLTESPSCPTPTRAAACLYKP